MERTGPNALTEKIARIIAESGEAGWKDTRRGPSGPFRCITFARYMQLCLYDDTYGYYRSGRVRIGKDGDFYTSPGIGTAMADVLASFVLEAARPFGTAEVVEWGAGTARLTAQMMAEWSRREPGWAEWLRPVIVEDHPAHLAAARNNVASAASGFGTGCAAAFLTSGEAESRGSLLPAVIIANELLDALPVHRVIRRNGRLYELGVAVDAEGESDGRSPFCYVRMPLSDERIAASLDADGTVLREGQETEVHLPAGEWLERIARLVPEGVLLIADYGHEAEEYAAAHRMKGTLLCYSRHVVHDDPFLNPGEQDITAHLNFTALRRMAARAGWSESFYGTQQRFLVENGILEALRDHDGTDPFGVTARRNRAIRQLLLSDAMSEAFKVLVLRR
ncbi:SAM-dependent methyltransferase [Paenibacillus cisolokensis]|uniref:class I SAM-dependent methyltransferase n=2 Tax=Paenibacillus TaxID=44249 RepID=UPI00072286FF|nr:SAM-dependent methyltransferase [Paenibacillus sp. 32O-W]ALS27336.1 SAM-dependent methyltransferase [Paenibacillus sp. 32O-W]